MLDDTPRLPLGAGGAGWPPAEANRAAEIAAWLESAPLRADCRWCVVDDLDVLQSPHAALFRGRFVRTTRVSGLTESCKEQICRILGRRRGPESG